MLINAILQQTCNQAFHPQLCEASKPIFVFGKIVFHSSKKCSKILHAPERPAKNGHFSLQRNPRRQREGSHFVTFYRRGFILFSRSGPFVCVRTCSQFVLVIVRTVNRPVCVCEKGAPQALRSSPIAYKMLPYP